MSDNPSFSGVINFGAFTPMGLAQLASSFRVNRTSHLFSAPEDAAGFAEVAVVFNPPFADAHYTVIWGVDDTDVVVDLNFFVGDIHFKTKTGFTAVVRNFSPGAGGTGETVIVNSIAIHD